MKVLRFLGLLLVLPVAAVAFGLYAMVVVLGFAWAWAAEDTWSQ